jgi:Zn-dependent protease
VFNLPSIRIGKLFGIPLEINASWLLVFVFVSSTLAFVYFPAQLGNAPRGTSILVGVVAALLFFASIVAHEFSHSLVAKAQGAKIARITLFMFGGVSEMTEEPAKAGQEFVMALAGPAMSILLSALFYVAFVALQAAGASPVLWAPAGYLAGINLAVGVFNLLPGFPMDGGRVLRAAFWGATHDLLKATKWASRIGQALGYSMVAIGILGVFAPGAGIGTLWLALLGWFLAGLAQTAYQQQVVKTRLSHVPVSAIMASPVLVAPGDLDLQQMVDDWFLGRRHSRYPISQDGTLLGMLSLSQVKAVPRERWGELRAADLADRDLSRLIVQADAPVDTVLDRLVTGGPGALLVADRDGELVGIVTRADVVHGLQEGLGR